MTTSTENDPLAEIWAIKDSLSAASGHDLKAACRALYAEQQKHPGDFVNPGALPREDKVPDANGGAAKSPVPRKRRKRPSGVSA